jgi:hypothetical protein
MYMHSELQLKQKIIEAKLNELNNLLNEYKIESRTSKTKKINMY